MQSPPLPFVRRQLLPIVVLALVACSKHDSAPPTPSPLADASSVAAPSASHASSAPGPDTALAKSVPATIDGQSVTLTNGYATWVNGLWLQIVLVAGPVSCTAPFPPPVPRIQIEIGVGPEQKFFAGEQIPTEMAVFYPPKAQEAQPSGWVKMTSVGRNVGDEAIGTFRLEALGKDRNRFDASGDFRVPLCYPAHALPVLPSVVANQPVQGVLGHHQRTFKSIVASTRHDPELDLDQVTGINFYPDAGVACTTDLSHEALHISLEELWSANPIVGRPIPFTAMHDIPAGDGGRPTFMSIGKVGWVRFGELELSNGGTMRGDLALDSPRAGIGEPEDHIEGHFVAKVCKQAP
jgi:hypothetical protein